MWPPLNGSLLAWSMGDVAEWVVFAVIWALLLWGLATRAGPRPKKRFR